MSNEWASIRRRVIRRDHQRCRRCTNKFKYSELQPHHIIPRSEGGHDDLSNLISLCSKCHDFVELSEIPLRTRALIENSLPADVGFVDVIERDDYRAPDWHAVVYGGQRK